MPCKCKRIQTRTRACKQIHAWLHIQIKLQCTGVDWCIRVSIVPLAIRNSSNNVTSIMMWLYWWTSIATHCCFAATTTTHCLVPSHSHVEIVKHNEVRFVVSTVNPVSFLALLVFVFARALCTSVCVCVVSLLLFNVLHAFCARRARYLQFQIIHNVFLMFPIGWSVGSATTYQNGGEQTMNVRVYISISEK